MDDSRCLGDPMVKTKKKKKKKKKEEDKEDKEEGRMRAAHVSLWGEKKSRICNQHKIHKNSH